MIPYRPGATSVDACLCAPSHFTNGDMALGCLKCPLGAECTGLGQTLERLPIRRGFFRISNTSDDVQRCHDSIAPSAEVQRVIGILDI